MRQNNPVIPRQSSYDPRKLEYSSARIGLGSLLPSMWRITGCILLLAVVCPLSRAQKRPTRYDVEAAYLYQLGNFVQWPPKKSGAAAQKSFSICVLGRDPFGPVLDQTVKDGTINGIPLTDRRIGAAQQAKGCQILFVSSSEQDDLRYDLNDLHDGPILTVSDIPDFIDRGGMIQFVLVGDRVRFRINLNKAQAAGLTLSSQLLKVAVSVRGRRNTGK